MRTLVDRPSGFASLTVTVGLRHGVLGLVVRGSLDATTGRWLLNDLAIAFEPSAREVQLDLAGVVAMDRGGVLAVDRCRAFAVARGARFRITELSRSPRLLDLREPTEA